MFSLLKLLDPLLEVLLDALLSPPLIPVAALLALDELLLEPLRRFDSPVSEAALAELLALDVPPSKVESICDVGNKF